MCARGVDHFSREVVGPLLVFTPQLRVVLTTFSLEQLLDRVLKTLF